MAKLMKDLLLFVLISVPFAAININVFSKGDAPDLYQAAASIVFIILWMLLGVYRGRRIDGIFLKHVTLFWGAGTVVLSVGLLTDVIPFIGVTSALICVGPLYGLSYFYDLYAPVFLYGTLLVLYVIIIAGFYAGRQSVQVK